jgi:plastocyanin
VKLIRRVLLLAMLATGATGAAAQGAEVAFDLKIEKGKVAQNMRLVRAKQGDVVKLRWTSDRPIVLHLHGYDIETKVTPGAVVEMVFTARATGRFPIEEHKPDARGGHSHGEAPLVRVEVRPR